MSVRDSFQLSLVLSGLLACVLMLGCQSAQNHPIFETLQEKGVTEEGSSGPFVELYVQFTGPQEKWSGPSTFVLHAVARDAKRYRLEVKPDYYSNDFAILKNKRKLAAAPGEDTSAKSKPMDEDEAQQAVEKARAMITRFAAEVQKIEDVKLESCLNPLSIWLVRSDGSIYERRGCRNTGPLSQAVSQVMHDFIDIHLGDSIARVVDGNKKEI